MKSIKPSYLTSRYHCILFAFWKGVKGHTHWKSLKSSVTRWANFPRKTLKRQQAYTD